MNKFISTSAAVWLTGALVLTPVASLAQQSTADLIAQLQAQITALQAQLVALSGGGGGGGAACGFTSALTVGSRGDAVTCLQNYLTSTGHFTYAGGATGYFGSVTQAAVAAWQAANGVSPAVGYFGPISQAKYNSMAVAPVTPTTPTTPTTETPTTPAVPSGTGLSVSAGAQPAAALVPLSVTRVPFTSVVFTAGSDGDVTVSSVTVERQGIGQDAALSGIVILGEDGLQLGLSKTLNSLHQAVLTEPFTVKAGTSKTMTIAANRGATTGYSGQVIRLTVVAVSAGSATVTGLPVAGTGQTMNETSGLVGGFDLIRGPLDPSTTGITKEVGTTGYVFSSIKGTAGAGEDIWIKSVKFNQSGSAATADLANVKVYVAGTAYDTTVSSDGKYYTSVFGTGVKVLKGNTAEIYVKGDIVSGSARTVDFDIYRHDDLYVVGAQYGYGLLPADTGTAGFDSASPAYNANAINIGAGSIVVSKSTAVASQNVAVTLADQPLGGFDVEVKGEAVTIPETSFRFTLSDSDGGAEIDVDDIDNIVLVGPSGAVVAGPVDGQAGNTVNSLVAHGYVTFTDSITFPIGKGLYTLKGKLAATSGFENNDTIIASTTPGTDWRNGTGAVTGTAVTPTPAGQVTGNTMTVKSAVVTVTLSSDPPAQNVVMGIQGFTFAKPVFDATASGEDIRFTTLSFTFADDTGADTTDLTGCQVWDGATALNTGTNVVDIATEGAKTFTLDSHLIIPKGTTKTLAIKCNIPANLTASNQAEWQIAASTLSATGVTSGQAATVTHLASTDDQNEMTLVAGGSLSVSLSASSPTYAIVAGNTTDVPLALLNLHATNEAITLQKLALKLSSTTNNAPADIVKYTLWDGSTKVGEGLFTGTDYSTSTLTADFVIPKDGDKTLTVKGDLSAIGTSQVGTEGALVVVDFDGGSRGTEGVGQSSGSTIQTKTADTATVSSTASNGVRMFKSYPTFAKVSLSTNKLAAGTVSLLRFKVTADSHGDIGLAKFTFVMSTTSATVQNLRVYGYSDILFSIAAYANSGLLNNTAIPVQNKKEWFSAGTEDNVLYGGGNQFSVYFDPVTQSGSVLGVPTDVIQVPAGATRYFDVVATVSSVSTNSSVSTQLEGDGAYPGLIPGTPSATNPIMGQASTTPSTAGIADQTHNDLIWSPNATTTAALSSKDWTNGFGVVGLPATNMAAEVVSY